MRLLHTSDWHLGQELYRHDRSFEHQKFLEWLTQVIQDQKVDVLLIAGDLYDTSNPPASAQRMFYNFVRDVKSQVKDLKIIAAAGNHDSPSRFEIPSEIFEIFSAHVIGRVVSNKDGVSGADKFLVPLYSDGSKEPRAVCLALPYLRSGDIFLPGEVISYPDAVVRVYQQAIEEARRVYGAQVPLIALGHMHATGGQISEESERKLVIGGEEAVALASLAHEFSYVALGHLHMPQKVGGFEHIRYSGSPLPMSFSEIHYPHQVILLDLEENQKITIQSLRVPRSVEMIRCPSKPQELDDIIVALGQLKIPDCPEEQRPFLEIPVQLNRPTPELRTRIDEALKNLPVRFCRLDYEQTVTSQTELEFAPMLGIESIKKIEPYKVFEALYEREYKKLPSDEVKSLFSEVLRELTAGDEQ